MRKRFIAIRRHRRGQHRRSCSATIRPSLPTARI